MAETYTKPLPQLTGYTADWFGFLKKHELRFQRCTNCGRWRHVPREYCAKCGSDAFEWAQSSGRGKVFTWTTTYRPLHPGFVADVPYSGVVVELEEGPRVMTWVTDLGADGLKMDMPVEVWFDDVTDEVTLAKFKPASA
jgi:uncharacterized OB-fold protein